MVTIDVLVMLWKELKEHAWRWIQETEHVKPLLQVSHAPDSRTWHQRQEKASHLHQQLVTDWDALKPAIEGIKAKVSTVPFLERTK